MTRRRKLWCGAALLLGGAVAAAATAWLLAPHWFGRPDAALRRRAAATCYYDRLDQLVHADPGFDHEWRFEVKLADLPPQWIQTVLAVEDRRFYEHHGVDYRAMLRAVGQNLTGGRIVSGSSTITMQLARMGDYRNRGYWNKFRQAAQARGIETRLTKNEILELYLNHLPYGGKIIGVEAAARYYFGRGAAELNPAEIALLAGVPQRPNALRPDRYPERARARQRIVLGMLEDQGVIAPGQAERLWRDGQLRWRDFSPPPEFIGPMRRRPADYNPHFFELAKREAPNDSRLSTTLDSALQQRALALLRQQSAKLSGVNDAGMVLIENATGQVLVLIGSIDFQSPLAGMVNAAVAPRQAGSTLKPFLYGEAIEAGLITPVSRLEDTPLNLADYRPGNFDGKFAGTVSAQTALADSLNTPAVRLLAKVTPRRVMELLQRAGFRRIDPAQSERVGLALALGGVEVDLLELTNACAGIARGGDFYAPRFLRTSPPPPVARLWDRGTAHLVSRMLRRPLPEAAELDLAWKTGTSNGNRDAWCIVWNPEYTLGVWFGNKDAHPAAALVGVTAAAPTAGLFFRGLYRFAPPPPWPTEEAAGLRRFALCPLSGGRPSPQCPEPLEDWSVAALPPALCQQCGNARPVAGRILSPTPGQYRLPPGAAVLRLPLRGTGDGRHWYADGRYLGFFTADFFHDFAPGPHRVWSTGDGDSAAATVVFTVERP